MWGAFCSTCERGGGKARGGGKRGKSVKEWGRVRVREGEGKIEGER